MNLCVTSGILPAYADSAAPAWKESAEFAKSVGFDEFDMMLTTPQMTCENWEQKLSERAEEYAKAGIRIRFIHTPFDYPALTDAEGWERFRLAEMRAIGKIKELGADCAAIHPRTYMKTDYDADEEHKAALEFLSPYVEHALQTGAVLALENGRAPGCEAHHKLRRYGCDLDEFLALADETGLGVCWDTGHANTAMLNQYKALKKVGSRLLEVHINDNFGNDDQHTAPFCGNVDWNAVTTALRETGYTNSINLEVTCKRTPQGLQRAYAQYMAESARELIRMIEG